MGPGSCHLNFVLMVSWGFWHACGDRAWALRGWICLACGVLVHVGVKVGGSYALDSESLVGGLWRSVPPSAHPKPVSLAPLGAHGLPCVPALEEGRQAGSLQKFELGEAAPPFSTTCVGRIRTQLGQASIQSLIPGLSEKAFIPWTNSFQHFETLLCFEPL